MIRGGAKRRGGADQEIDFLERTTRRFAAALCAKLSSGYGTVALNKKLAKGWRP